MSFMTRRATHLIVDSAHSAIYTVRSYLLIAPPIYGVLNLNYNVIVVFVMLIWAHSFACSCKERFVINANPFTSFQTTQNICISNLVQWFDAIMFPSKWSWQCAALSPVSSVFFKTGIANHYITIRKFVT